MTQRERVLAMLRGAGTRGICGVEFLEARLPRFPARIYELRDGGLRITRRRCDLDGHRHGSTQYVYELEEG